MDRIPVITLVLAAAALAAAPLGVEAWIELRPGAVMHGEAWRMLTGHLAHYGTSHLAWDVVVFVAAGAIAERCGRWSYLALLLASATAVSAAVMVLQPGLAAYRGLSGVDSALFVYVCANLLAEAWRAGERGWIVAALAALLAFGGKAAFEHATGTTIFAQSDGRFTPVPLAHAVGGLVGLAWATLGARPRRQPGAGAAAAAARALAAAACSAARSCATRRSPSARRAACRRA